MEQFSFWQKNLKDIDLSDWPISIQSLLQTSSLTAALSNLEQSFSVRLLCLGASEYEPLLQREDESKGHKGFTRDVLLCLNDEPVVWARSCCLSTAHEWCRLLDCGQQPLGKHLFDGSLPLSRTQFEFATLSKKDLHLPFESDPIISRRSFWLLHNKELGLMECFLANLKNYLS